MGMGGLLTSDEESTEKKKTNETHATSPNNCKGECSAVPRPTQLVAAIVLRGQIHTFYAGWERETVYSNTENTANHTGRH
jgi:hypothetical protein